MIKLDVDKLKELVDILGTCVDSDLLCNKIPFILLWVCKGKLQGYDSGFVYLVDLISLKVIYKPLDIHDDVTPIYITNKISGRLMYDYRFEAGNYVEKGSAVIDLQRFIPMNLWPNVHTEELAELNTYDYYICTLINLIDTKIRLPSTNYVSNISVESYVTQIKSMKREINERLEDMVNKYPINSVI